MKKSVFVVDDHYMVIEGIRSLLQPEPAIELLGYAMNAEACLGFLRQNQPDVLLLDINLPGMGGIELCKKITTAYPAVKVLGLSTFNQQPYIRGMMDSGASGYLLKNASKDELILAIETVMEGGQFFSTEAAESLKEDSMSAPVLTRREKEVLALIADGWTNGEIAEKLFVSIPTVNSHRKSLLEKFDAKNVAEMIKLAMQGGF